MKDQVKQALDILAKHKRVAYIPQVEENNTAQNDTQSKLGGLPYLRHENDWPTCPNCKQHLQLFLQLNLKTIPEKASDGLVQVFYCTNHEKECETELEGFFPFSEAHCCRLIRSKEKSSQFIPGDIEIFKEKIIKGWEAKDDYPHYEEWFDLGLEDEIDDDVFEYMEENEIGTPLQGDKLFGWPYWVQSVEYPNDRETGSLMGLLFQLDSEDHIPFMFGDMGTGHVTQSPDNENELAFGWACG